MSENSGLVIPFGITDKKFAQQLARAEADARKKARQIEKSVTGVGDAAGASAQKAGKEMTSFFNVSKGGRFALQNATNQFADMAVQMEMGTNPMRVMGQQIPQLVAGFGALGGSIGILMPILGMVAGLGFPIAAFLMQTSSGADDAATSVDKFSKAFSEADSAISRANSSIKAMATSGLDDVKEQYGEVTDAVLELIEVLGELDTKAAVKKASLSVGVFFDETLSGNGAFQSFEDQVHRVQALYHKLEQLNDPVSGQRSRDALGIEGHREAIAELNAELEQSPEKIKRWIALLEQVEAGRVASDMGQVSDALAEMREILTSLPDADLAEVGNEMARLESIARKAVGTTERLEDAAKGVSFEEASKSATDMAEEISRAADALADMKAKGALSLEEAHIKLKYKDDPQGLAGALAGREFDTAALSLGGSQGRQNHQQLMKDRTAYIEQAKELARIEAGMRPAKKEKKSYSSADVIGLGEKDITTLARQIEMLDLSSDRVAELTTKYKLLDTAKAHGLDLDEKSLQSGLSLREEIERRAHVVGGLTAQLEEASHNTQVMNTLNQQLTSSFTALAFEGANFGEVLESLAKQFASMAAQDAFGTLLSGAFGGAPDGSTSGNMLSSLLSSFGGFFASGGTLGAGKWGIAGENGPEPIVGPATIIPNHALSGGGGSSSSTVHVIVKASDMFEPMVESVAGNVVAQAAPAIAGAGAQQSRPYTQPDMRNHHMTGGGDHR
ncbi:Prophage tail length tape measure protein [Pseudovibrio axinellae]|uniref:Prophage tail length tape measure protein n=1 Tax=Pseudovibrio axinellae TaxID=989403 RepID=A0A165SVS7_9HYPH|nr:phage tail length tape measure family protein [Pseudovibrio axinellae]KZL04539.1 Prophage tail length tape measure protein [Pseudovibrio axinellae]SEQ73861.1 hypothetical protein SAMN05421798_10486 [Pseudovibrio axinellae]